MPWFARTDGLDGAHAAHRQCSLGGLNEVVRDRAPGPVDLSIRFWCPDPAVPGDTEITEREYDDFHGPMTVQNYEAVFIPMKEARLAARQQAAATLDAEAEELETATLPSALKAATRRALTASRAQAAERVASLVSVLADDAAELAQCRVDVADPNSSVRMRRAG